MASTVRPTHRDFRLISSYQTTIQDRHQRSNRFILINNNAPKLKTSYRNYSSLLHRRKPLQIPHGARGLGWIPTVVRGVLKLRYLLLGGTIGGGISLAKVCSLSCYDKKNSIIFPLFLHDSSISFAQFFPRLFVNFFFKFFFAQVF